MCAIKVAYGGDSSQPVMFTQSEMSSMSVTLQRSSLMCKWKHLEVFLFSLRHCICFPSSGMWFFFHINTDFCIFRPLRNDPCNSRRSEFFFWGGWGCLVGYCMIEIMQMDLSYYLNKLRKDWFLKHGRKWNYPGRAARVRGAICRTVKCSNDSKSQTRAELAL